MRPNGERGGPARDKKPKEITFSDEGADFTVDPLGAAGDFGAMYERQERATVDRRCTQHTAVPSYHTKHVFDIINHTKRPTRVFDGRGLLRSLPVFFVLLTDSGMCLSPLVIIARFLLLSYWSLFFVFCLPGCFFFFSS